MGSLGVNLPSLIVVGISIVIGLVMVVVFRYTSDQKAIHVAKDHLKAHLLALRLFQDQIPVVLTSYGRIVLSTGRYLRLAFMPLLLVIIPLTLVMVQIDRYLAFTPLEAGRAFLVTAHVTDAAALNEASLQLPDGLAATAAPVHVSADNDIVWRVMAGRDGDFTVNVQASEQVFSKRVVVGAGLPRLSPIRLRGQFWERLFYSAEAALPENKSINAIAVQYPEREIRFAWVKWNWIWLFFLLSLAAGFLFKSVLGIQI